MTALLADWDRPYFLEPGGEPLLFYAVYGTFGSLPPLPTSEFRSAGTPPECELSHYDSQKHRDVLAQFKEGYLWDQLLVENSALAAAIDDSEECLILRMERDDSETLNYLRDCVGLITFLLDHGGITVYDPLMFKWWSPQEWRTCIFEPGSPVPRHHVVILTSEEPEPNLTWFHTRGMRKFGRPDLSIHNVSAELNDAAIDLCNRFIEFQGFGGVIPEGQAIRMKSLPAGMTCHHGGSVDDPDFNNFHVEICWPECG